MTTKSTQTKRYIKDDLREVKGKGKFLDRYERGKKEANDNLKYGTKKYAVQAFNDYANLTLDSVSKGHDLSQTDLDILQGRYDDIKAVGGSTEDAMKKMKRIKMFHKGNQDLLKQGKDPFIERQAFDT
jgi:hypothetical protein